MSRCWTVQNPTDHVIQTLLRFNLQPCRLDKPFDEMVVGFYVHHNFNFVISERPEDKARDSFLGNLDVDAGAIDGAYDA